MKIESLTSSVKITYEGNTFCFPCNKLICISMNDSATVTFRLKGNRRNLFSVPYAEIEGINATSAEDAINKINSILNK